MRTFPLLTPQKSIILNVALSTTAQDGLILWYGERSGGFRTVGGNFVAIGGKQQQIT
jgi:hypothetical protein